MGTAGDYAEVLREIEDFHHQVWLFNQYFSLVAMLSLFGIVASIMHAGLSRIEGDRAESARSYVLSAVLATTVGQLFGLAFPSIAWTPFFVFMVMLPYLGASTYHIYLAKKKMKKNKEDKRTTSEPQKRVNRDEKTS